MEIQFIDATTEDTDAILALIYQLEHDIPRDTLLNNLKKYTQEKDCRFFVAKENEKVIAFAELHFLHFIYEARKRARLAAFCVDEQHRNKKVGEKFLQFIEELCHANDVYRIELTSNVKRADAHRFYEQHGYTFSSKAFHKTF